MTEPRIVSVNVSLPKPVVIDGEEVMTGIYKEPVSGRVRVHTTNIDGDGQADLTVHGGPQKAVYAYPASHYPFWREELDRELSFGAFGENLTIEGLDETTIRTGDALRVGTVLFRVTIPRQPCFKLAHKFGRNDIIKRFWKSGRSGFYLAVIEEGELGAGDIVSVEFTDVSEPTVADVLDERRSRRNTGPS